MLSEMVLQRIPANNPGMVRQDQAYLTPDTCAGDKMKLSTPCQLFLQAIHKELD